MRRGDLTDFGVFHSSAQQQYNVVFSPLSLSWTRSLSAMALYRTFGKSCNFNMCKLLVYFFSLCVRRVFFFIGAMGMCACVYSSRLRVWHKWFLLYYSARPPSARTACHSIAVSVTLTMLEFNINIYIASHWLNMATRNTFQFLLGLYPTNSTGRKTKPNTKHRISGGNKNNQTPILARRTDTIRGG